MPKKIITSIFILSLLIFVFILASGLKLLISYKPGSQFSPPDELNYWQIQSIDTMKYSRDMAREYINKKDAQQEIDAQIAKIADTGANYVAIGTPYDDEFMPILKLWVNSARDNDLSVWFRGNWSGWENWFGYNSITPDEHIQMTRSFIRSNTDLFRDGDIFTACTECENGQLGDPRFTGKVQEYRDFLIKLDDETKSAFDEINKKVMTNFYSMNGDIANLIMDEHTTKALGGIVTIDHYVATPEQLNSDINTLAQRSGGKVMLGEVGVPIPDIHGEMTQEEKAQWLDNLFLLLSANPNIIGINYWVNVGGSTRLWNEDLSHTQLSFILKKYYQPTIALGTIVNKDGRALKEVAISNGRLNVRTDVNGKFWFPLSGRQLLKFEKDGYSTKEVYLENDYLNFTIPLEKE